MKKKYILRFFLILVILAFTFEAYSQAVWVEDFNSLTPGSNWRGRSGLTIMANGGVNNSQCVRVEYDIRQDPLGTTVRQWKQPVPPALEYTLQYDLYFESNWNNSYGGKFHGFSPKTHVTGCNPVRPHTWSARMVLRNREPRLYLYDQKKTSNCGRTIGSDVRLEKERWYSVSYYLKVNSSEDKSDGEARLYIDGELVSSASNMQFHAEDGDHTKITDFFFSTFLVRNSTGPVVSRQYMRYDNFAVVPGKVIRASPGNNDDLTPGILLFLQADDSRGSVIKSPDKEVYDEGEEVVLTAEANSGFRFTNWTGDLTSDDNPLTVTMDSTIRLTANFAPIYTVTISENTVNGTVDVFPEKEYYEAGESVTFTPHPAPGYSFGSWYADGGISGNTVPLVVSINRDIELSAFFNLITYQLFTSANNGSITRNPNSSIYTAGTQVELTANPNDGYEFTGWSGYVTSHENPLTIAMDSVIYLTANFDLLSNTDQKRELSFNVFPNPSKGTFAVDISQSANYNVYNLFGVRLKEGKAYGSFNLDMEGYADGVYVLVITTKEGVIFKRIVIK